MNEQPPKTGPADMKPTRPPKVPKPTVVEQLAAQIEADGGADIPAPDGRADPRPQGRELMAEKPISADVRARMDAVIEAALAQASNPPPLSTLRVVSAVLEGAAKRRAA